jgi:histone H3/H4
MYRLIREVAYDMIEFKHQECEEANLENRRLGVETDIKFDINPEEIRFTSQSLEILHESSEFFLVNLFEDSNLVSMVAKRQTLMPIDIKLVRHLRRHTDSDSTATDSLSDIKRQINEATGKIKKRK